MATAIDRDWITAELIKAIAAEDHLAAEARARAESPPDPALRTLYGEIATDDERHHTILETIATRYGHTPERGMAGGIGEALSRIKERVSEIGTNPIERLGHDLADKAQAVHWYTAWTAAFESAGEAESARELAAILIEETAHRDALLEGLKRLVLQGVQGTTQDDPDTSA